MTKTKKLIVFAILMLCFGSISANAQKPPADYKITNVKIIPFDGQTGKFQDEIKPNDERSFYNDLDISLLVIVEISGEAGTYGENRNVLITSTEGNKSKAKKDAQIGVIGENGKFYIPLWLDSAMCSDITITAKITGQKTASSMTRKVPFLCGE